MTPPNDLLLEMQRRMLRIIKGFESHPLRHYSEFRTTANERVGLTKA